MRKFGKVDRNSERNNKDTQKIGRSKWVTKTKPNRKAKLIKKCSKFRRVDRSSERNNRNTKKVGKSKWITKTKPNRKRHR